MDKKMENVCLRVTKLACVRVAEHLAGINGLKDASEIKIRVKDRDALMQIVAAIIQKGHSEQYQDRIEAVLSVKSAAKLKHDVNWVRIFLQNVDACRDARVCQKRILDLLAAEQYLLAAYEYDVKHRSSKAMQLAKKVVIRLHSERFLEGFPLFGKPKIDAGLKSSLSKRAFDTWYSYTSSESVIAMAKNRYLSVYRNRKDFFLTGAAPESQGLQNRTAARHAVQAKAVIPVPEKEAEPVMDMRLLEYLYGTGFADMPLKGKRRKFVNLAVRSKDVRDMPRRMLVTKKRFLTIESLTKHSYIYGFYEDHIKGVLTGEAVFQYYLQKEAEMYQVIRYMQDNINLDRNIFYFPDGVSLQIPAGQTAYDFLHKVNTIYAALFGFSQEDSRGGGMWLEDSVRSAYTDEGVADYRLGIVAARLSGQMR